MISITSSPFHLTFRLHHPGFQDNVFCSVHISVQFSVNGQQCEDALLGQVYASDQGNSGSGKQQRIQPWEATNRSNIKWNCGTDMWGWSTSGKPWRKKLDFSKKKTQEISDSVDHGQHFHSGAHNNLTHTQMCDVVSTEGWGFRCKKNGGNMSSGSCC